MKFEISNLKKFTQSHPVEAILLIFIVLGGMLISAGFAFPFSGELNTDYPLHLTFANKYAQGNYLAAFDAQYKTLNNGVPYPPLFHLMLASFIVFGILKDATIFLQLISYSAILLSAFYVSSELLGVKKATIITLILVGSGAFFDRIAAVSPQSFDLFLLPLVILWVMKDKPKLVLLSLLVMIYSHSAYGFLIYFGIILYYLLFDRTNEKLFSCIKWTFILSLPIILINVIYLIPGLTYAAGESNAQNLLFKRAFTTGVDLDTAILFIGIPFITLLFSNIYIIFKRNELVSKNKSLLLTSLIYISMLPLAMTMVDRFISYSIFPVTFLLIGGLLKEEDIKSWHLILLTFLVLVYWFFAIDLFLIY